MSEVTKIDRATLLDHLASIVTQLANTPKTDGTERWKPGADGKTYRKTARLGQMHVNTTDTHYGIDITVYDYGVPTTKSALKDENDALKAKIAELEKTA